MLNAQQRSANRLTLAYHACHRHNHNIIASLQQNHTASLRETFPDLNVMQLTYHTDDVDRIRHRVRSRCPSRSSPEAP